MMHDMERVHHSAFTLANSPGYNSRRNRGRGGGGGGGGGRAQGAWRGRGGGPVQETRQVAVGAAAASSEWACRCSPGC